MNWNLVVGPASLLLGMLAALYVRDQARETANVEFNKNIAAALAVFKLDLLESLDETYVRSGESKLILESQADRIDVHEIRISQVEARLNDMKQFQHRK